MNEKQGAVPLREVPEDFEFIRLFPENLRRKWLAQLRYESWTGLGFGSMMGVFVGSMMISNLGSDDDLGFVTRHLHWILPGYVLILVAGNWGLQARRRKMNAELFRTVVANGDADDDKLNSSSAKFLGDIPENFNPATVFPEEVRSEWVISSRSEAMLEGLSLLMMGSWIAVSSCSDYYVSLFREENLDAPEVFGIFGVSYQWIFFGLMMLSFLSGWMLRKGRRQQNARLKSAIVAQAEQ